MEQVTEKPYKPRMKKIFILVIRETDEEEWGVRNYYRTAKSRDTAARINRVMFGMRTHSFDERVTLDDFENLAQ